MLTLYPHHRFEGWQLIHIFYTSLTTDFKQYVETNCVGDLWDKSSDEAFGYFDYLANIDNGWSFNGTYNYEYDQDYQGEPSYPLQGQNSQECLCEDTLQEFMCTYGGVDHALQNFMKNQASVNSRVDETLEEIKN